MAHRLLKRAVGALVVLSMVSVGACSMGSGSERLYPEPEPPQGGSSNRPPEGAGTITVPDLTAGAAAHQVDVASYFTDPDGDALSYKATSVPDSVVEVAVAGSAVTITPIAEGTATITVTAADPAGETATQQFNVNVVPATINRPPEGAGTITVPDLTAGAAAHEVDVASYFTDPDGDALSYKATSVPDSVVEVAVAGSAVTITPIAEGTATITVTAADPAGETATQQFKVNVVSATIPAEAFMFSCPTPAEVAAIDRELELRFIDDPTAGEPLACSEEAGSVDLTEVQMGAYQTLRLLKGAMFSEPLPWTRGSLWDWLVATIDGIEFDSNVATSFCCRGRNIVVRTFFETDASGEFVSGWTWIYAYRYPERLLAGYAAVSGIQLYVHEARHAEGPGHTCGIGNDQTFAEMGAWAYVYYTLLWFEQKYLPTDFFSPASLRWMSDARQDVCDVRICAGDCPG